FINNLPGGKSTQSFSTENASGSTSQAAAIIETLETGSKLLLIDEDISATNFLIRDERMQKLIAPEKEPITPFVQRIRSLYETRNVSTILVLGGSGDYFGPADHIIALDNYLPQDLTTEAKALVSQESEDRGQKSEIETADQQRWNAAFGRVFTEEKSTRHALSSSISPFKSSAPYRGSKRGRFSDNRPPKKNIKTRGTVTLTFGTTDIDLSLIPQIVDASQVRTLGAALAYAADEKLFDEYTLIEALEEVILDIEEDGLSILRDNDLAEIRLQELAATLNRLRALKVEKKERYP
ncbi:MAG: P-loop domain-containing protein, partial [Verrucomicrobiota bacterium]